MIRRRASERRGPGRRSPARTPPRPRLFKPLDRSYWPDGARYPIARLLVAILLAPLPVIAGASLLAWLAYSGTEPDPIHARAMALRMANIVLREGYLLGVVGAVALTPVLWTMRRRSFWSWCGAGAVVGAVAALISFENSAVGGFMPIPFFAITLFSMLVFIVLRWMAGIRPIA